MMKRRSLVLGLLAGLAMSASAQAQLGPGKTITLMVPYPAGGPSDAIARIIAPRLQQVLGQTVLIENLGGASGGLAAMKLLQTPADGRMIFQGSPNELILSPLTNPDIKFKPNQFRHVTQITKNPLILLARPDLPANNIDELIKYSKKLGKPTPYGSVGVGSLYHILSEDLAKQAGLKVTHVPYRGAAPMFQDLAGGAVDFAILPYQASYKGLQEQKKLKMLGWVSEKRDNFIPELVAFGESKGLPKFDHAIWAGLFVRAETPDDIATKINAAIAETMKTPEVRAALEKMGSIPVDTTSLAVAQSFFEAEVAKLNGMTKDMEFKIQ
ncbi:MAG: tripartite tricarboxylate transporter substrate binding protein [Hyphomicrobiales bacterium]|nr:tripartite tricarboxylate transporter substrate binding protein [Hyphomicrobiales bacterium]